MSYRQHLWSAAVAAALGLSMQPVAWAQDAVAQAVEPGRCGKFVAWIDLLLSPQPPKVSNRVDTPAIRLDVTGRFDHRNSDKMFSEFEFAI